MTPFERLIAQRADPEMLSRYRREDYARPLAFHRWNPDSTDDMLRYYLGPELSRDPERLRQIVVLDSDYVGVMTIILDIRPGTPAFGVGEGYCELGTILSSEDYYDFGADLVALRGAGVELSWEAAQWVHAAGRAQLVEREGHGTLTPRKIRLALFHPPTPEDPARNDGIAPPAFAFEGDSHHADASHDLAELARAVARLTKHPDPTIDRLLRDTDSHEVLRDLLLQRGGAVEALLGDAAEIELEWLPLPEAESIDGELADLWNEVLRLDPMIDTSDPAIFDLPGPAVGEYE